MSAYFAQRGTKVTVVEGLAPKPAEYEAARRLKVRIYKSEMGPINKDPSADIDWTTPWVEVIAWPPGSVFREATDAEVALWAAAREQLHDLRGVTKKQLRDAVRGHEQGTLA